MKYSVTFKKHLKMADDLNEKKRKKKEKQEKNSKRPRTSTKKPGFNKDIFKETEYFIKDGLRYVKPYCFTFTTYCKGRWLGRKLIDVLSEEFQSETSEYYRNAIANGNIRVNESEVKDDLILKDNDIISHKVHRHEPPVTSETIQIISETEDLVVVNKPSSIPIHPCGRYRHNTLVFLLGREFGLPNLYTIHRIDRLTSGIVMFAKSLEKAQQLEKQLRDHELKKEYVCKVKGEFPSDVIDCNEPIAVVSHKVGICRVNKDGKPCRTIFTRESFDGTNSIVKCQPFTGRMHQIRVHLQWLGYPIINDPIYNHKAWGQDRGKGGVEEKDAWKVIESIANAMRNNDTGLRCQSDFQTNAGSNEGGMTTELRTKTISVENSDTMCETLGNEVKTSEISGTKEEIQQDIVERDSIKKETLLKEVKRTCNEETKQDDKEKDICLSEIQEKVPGCTECQIKRRDPTPEELTMCLHAAVYKGPDWEYKCPWPQWALPNINS